MIGLIEKNMKFMCLKYPWVDYVIYRRIMLFVSVSIMIFFLIIGYIYFEDVLNAILFSSFLTLISIAFFNYYPVLIRNHYQGLIDRDLPYFLMDLDVKLSVGMDFIGVLKSLRNEYSLLGNIVSKVIARYDKGTPLYKSFIIDSNYFESQDLARSFNQMLAVYDSGYNYSQEGPLLSLSQELLDKQKSMLKVFQSKLVLISLLFIGTTALLPSLFLIYVAIGGAIMNIGLTGIEVLLIFVLVFPIIDAIIVLVIYLMTPNFVRG